jgi:hypothetical protein
VVYIGVEVPQVQRTWTSLMTLMSGSYCASGCTSVGQHCNTTVGSKPSNLAIHGGVDDCTNCSEKFFTLKTDSGRSIKTCVVPI